MKAIKSTLFFVCCLLTTMLVYSCSDDDSTGLTAITSDQKALYNSSINGSYTGYLHWFDFNDSTKVDSTAITWDVTSSDSTITIPNFPVSVLASSITDPDDKAIFDTISTQTVKMNYYVPTTESSDYINKGIYRYYAYATDNALKVEYDSSTQDSATINFGFKFLRGIYYYPRVTVTNNSYAQNIIIESVAIGENEYTISNGFFWLTGKK